MKTLSIPVQVVKTVYDAFGGDLTSEKRNRIEETFKPGSAKSKYYFSDLASLLDYADNFGVEDSEIENAVEYLRNELTYPDVELEEADKVVHEPDVYSGENCDEHRPRWVGDFPKHGKDDVGDTVSLKVEHFPPGTEIRIYVPDCPRCGESADIYWPETTCGCGFDWHKWADEKYGL